MCGIVGMVVKADNGLNKKTDDTFFDMLYVDTIRGDDSTGVIYVENDASFGYMKDANAATWCGYSMQNDPAVKGMWSRGKAYIGHNRKKTVGAVSDETSHPFVVDRKFAMVHNGTLYNHKALANTTVDSEALAIHLSSVLNEDYTKEKLEEALGKVSGAYAIAAYNQDTHKIYLTRNKERPLAILETDDGFFWASEGAMLYWILSRNGLDWKENKVQSIKENSLVVIDLATNKMTVEDYVPKKAIPPAPPTVIGGQVTVTKTPTKTTPSIFSKAKLSKNEFKRIKRRFLYTKVCFYASDFLEKNFPRTLYDGENEVILLGESDTFNFDHSIQAEFDVYDIIPGQVDLTECYYTGRIVDMTYENVRGYVMIVIDNVKMVPPSLKRLINEAPITPLALH